MSAAERRDAAEGGDEARRARDADAGARTPFDAEDAEHGTNAERIAPTSDPDRLEEHSERVERHNEQMPDTTGISGPQPRRSFTEDGDEQAGEPAPRSDSPD